MKNPLKVAWKVITWPVVKVLDKIIEKMIIIK